MLDPANLALYTKATRYFQQADPLAYHGTLENYRPTETVQLLEQAKTLNVGEIFLKDESSRFGMNAFKALGASFAIHEILKSTQKVGAFCTASAGNHGQAIAKYAKHHNKRAVIFVPKNTPTITVERISQHNPEIHQLQTDYQGACETAMEASHQYGWTLIQDTAWVGYEDIPTMIMAGYLTQMYELDRQIDLRSIDVVFLQVGVGSWAASVAWYLLQYYRGGMPKIVLVEPMASCGMFVSLQANRLKKPNNLSQTIMSGLNCGIPSTIAFEILRNTASAVMKIDDTDTISSMKTLDMAKINAGPSGVAGFAALAALMGKNSFARLRKSLGMDKNSKILLFNTEGAVNTLQ